MTHPFLRVSRRLVFAHRGGSGLAPENTAAAFDNGIALGADGLELDVRLSADGVAVVHHDATLDRTTNLRGPVRQRTATELARADAGFHFADGESRPFRGHRIGVPGLAEVLIRHRDARIIIELKEEDAALAVAAVAAVRAADAVERVCLGSFSRRALRHVRAIAPEIATSAARPEVRWALYRSKWGWPVRRASYLAYQVPETSGGTRVVSPRFVDDAHELGVPVQVWTVDAPADAERLLAWGVDALITDRPDLIVPLVARPT